jgi:hypothetical protein
MLKKSLYARVKILLGKLNARARTDIRGLTSSYVSRLKRGEILSSFGCSIFGYKHNWRFQVIVLLKTFTEWQVKFLTANVIS